MLSLCHVASLIFTILLNKVILMFNSANKSASESTLSVLSHYIFHIGNIYCWMSHELYLVVL